MVYHRRSRETSAPGAEIHRTDIRWNADVAKIAGAIRGELVSAETARKFRAAPRKDVANRRTQSVV